MAKKEKNCDPSDPADDRKGDTWDHVAIDAESRLILSVVPGERTPESVVAVVADFKRRTGGRLMNLMTTDGYPAYEVDSPGRWRDGHAAPDRQTRASQSSVQVGGRRG